VRRGRARSSCPAAARSCQSHPARTPKPAQGDTVEILIITKDGIRREELELKKD
jgi:hypothetical protein